MSNVNGIQTIIPPPNGYEVDFANPQRRLVTETYILFILENIIALCFLVQRLYTKIRLMKQFQIDDGIAPEECQRRSWTDQQQSSLFLLGRCQSVLKLV
jgi:hypothetical protein